MNKTIIIFIALLVLPIMTMAQGKLTRPRQKQETTKRSNNKKSAPTSSAKPTLKNNCDGMSKTQQSVRQQISSKTYTVNGVSFEMMRVEGGTFTMGGYSGDAYPVHAVTVNGFYIGQTEVTQSLWKAIMGNNPSYFKGDNCPVECVSWYDCQEFITKLNNLTGKSFRLPTEAEWEFAARGGNNSNNTLYSGGFLVDVGWYKDNSGGKTHPVAQKQANELGIYDMSGNVWEWCSDWYGKYSSDAQTNPLGPNDGPGRVCRGGHWESLTACCYITRYYRIPGLGWNGHGLRLCLSENQENSEMTNSNLLNTQVRQSINSQTYTANSVSFEMMRVESGTFTMGATSEMDSRNSDEKPTHSVTLSGFYIGQTEVTQALWKAVMDNNPSKNKGDNLPVESVSWDDCQNFISKLNIITGKHFRLPTEAEWEFAARGGNNSNHTQYSGSGNIDDVAWYGGNGGNSGRKTHPVAQKQANELGIYDMSGNVYEWCSDWFDSYSSATENNPVGPSNGTSRVFRGGCCDFDMWSCRCSYRARSVPSYHNNALGFVYVSHSNNTTNFMTNYIKYTSVT